MMLNKQTICDPFVLLKTDKQNIGIATFQINNCSAGVSSVMQIDVYGELLAHAASPIRKSVLINMLSNHGFHISPLPNALETFLHLLLFPEDAITMLGKIVVAELPENADVISITTCSVEGEINHDSH